MEVSVEVGGWDHECCGPARERHHLEAEVRVRGRIVDVLVVRPGQPPEPVERLPSGRALRGVDPDDDGHLEQAWTEVPVPAGRDFVLVVQVAVPGAGRGRQ